MAAPRILTLEGADGRATLSTLGATVLSFVPRGGDDLLWCSPLTRFEEGRAVRGGIPICWPWFASDPQFPGSHGLVRSRSWAVDRVGEADGDATAELSIEHPGDAVYGAFRLSLLVRVGRTLLLKLTHHNLGDAPQRVSGALHTYLRARADQARVHGLSGATAFDKRTGAEVVLPEAVGFAEPVDRVVPSQGVVVLHDGPRRVRVEGRGHSDVVLWNPGDEAPSDVPPGGAAGFVCVETAVVSEPWEVPPGGRRTLGLRLGQP